MKVEKCLKCEFGGIGMKISPKNGLYTYDCRAKDAEIERLKADYEARTNSWSSGGSQLLAWMFINSLEQPPEMTINGAFVIPSGCPYILEHTVSETEVPVKSYPGYYKPYSPEWEEHLNKSVEEGLK